MTNNKEFAKELANYVGYLDGYSRLDFITDIVNFINENDWELRKSEYYEWLWYN